MQFAVAMKQTLRTLTALALALIPTIAMADQKIEDLPKADPKAPLASWTPVQQWREGDGMTSSHPVKFSLMADELGSRLSELGRARVIQNCLRHAEKLENGALAWSVCRYDVNALDLKKLENELTAAGITGVEKTSTLEYVKDIVKTAKLTGDPIEALAKTEPGVQQILKQGDDARTEWAAYESKNKTIIDRYLALKDAVRTNRGNDQAFAGCYEATQPAFAKVVKAALSKIPYDTGKDAIDGYTSGYLSYIPTAKESYIAAVSYAACLWSLHDSAAHFYRLAGSQPNGKSIAGPRTLAISKLIDETFKPKFADRSLGFNRPSDWSAGPPVEAASQRDAALVNAEGTIGTMKANGEMTKVVFKGEEFERCIQYKNDADKTCVKRGMVYDSVGEGTAPTKFLAGAKPGLEVAIKFGFPEVVWSSKTKKLLTILTIPVR